MINVSDLVADIFLKKGIKKVFIYPGGTIMPIINSLIKKKLKSRYLNQNKARDTQP